MTDPVTIAAGLQAVGTIAAGNAAAKQAKFQAELTRRQAERARQVADMRAAQIRRQRSREDAHLRARLMASGIDAGGGSALLTLESRAGDAELDALYAINEGQYRSGLLDADARLTRFRGDRAKQEAKTRAATTLLRAL